MKSFKKVVALVAVIALSITALVGCKKQVDIDDSEIVMTVGDKEVPLGLANFFARYQQSTTEQMYQMYGMEIDWSYEVEKGMTYEESMKDGIMKSLQQLYVLDAHAAEYNIALTEDETAKIDEVAKTFEAANGKEDYNKISGVYVKEYLRLVTIKDKMHEAIKASYTPEVKDGEADQKIMYYVKYDTVQTNDSGNTSKLSDAEVAKLKKEAKAMLDGATSNGNLEAYAKEQGKTATKAMFNKDNDTLDKKLVKAADKLELNGFTDIIQGESAIYVAQVTSLFDQEATDNKKAEIIQERKEEFYTETVEKWTKEAEIKVYDEVWDKVSLDAMKVTTVTPKKEESSEKEENKN